MAFRVIVPGALSTVQDLGRFGYQKSGMSCSGVTDQKAYESANQLVNNQKNEAVIEHTVFGGSYRFQSDTVIALTGADMKPSIDGKACPMYRPVFVPSGGILSLGAAVNGCRNYLAAAGGILVPPVLGSRSTNLKCKIGGFQGRALQSGDLLDTGTLSVPFQQIKDLSLKAPVYSKEIKVRVIEGPQSDYFTEKGLNLFYSAPYTVSEQSDRMGCRLEGPAVESIHGTDIVSDGIVFGSIQITSSGMPIVLMADRQTTGGYAKIATVITDDLPLLAQAVPGTTIHFQKMEGYSWITQQ